MQAWFVVPGPDGGVLELRDVEVPSPGGGQVLVAVGAAGVNRGEVLARPLLRSSNPNAQAQPSGIEFAGTIAALGDGVSGYAVGDAVMGRGTACHADYTVVNARAMTAAPAGLSVAEAAALPNVFVTAHDAIVTNAALGAGEAVVITAAPSGVGTAALQIAKLLGAGPIIATTRSAAAKGDALRALGADVVIDATAPDWVTQVRAAAGPRKGADVVIDQVGGPMVGPLLETMALCGRYVTVGRNAGPSATIDIDLVARQRLHLIGVTFRTRTLEESLRCSEACWADLSAGFRAGALRPVLHATFPLGELPAAHEAMMADGQVGKIVLVAG